MKIILLCSNTAWSIYNFRRTLVSRLLEQGHTVIVLAPHDQTSEKLIQLGCQFIDISISAQGTNPIKDVKLIYSLFKTYKRLKPDVILHYTIKPNIYGSMAAGLAKIKNIATVTGAGFTFTSDTWLSKVARLLYRIAFRYPAKIVFQNLDDRREFISYKLLDSKLSEHVPGSGVDLHFYTPQPSSERDKTTFLLVARMLWDKGIGEYVEAAKILKEGYPDIELQMAGASNVPNPSAIPIEQINHWQEQGLINYLGYQNDIRSLIANADCVVLPSYREGVPRSLLEAAAMGKPVITTDTQGCRDVVIAGKTGWLCPVKDAHALADCMKEFLSLEKEDRARMGTMARSFIEEKFDEEIIIKKYMAMIAEITL
ncbi:glycosyltransferase family 4 protein [Paludibacterium sp. THUN1379]|uniref:glycosyltransferase family 4 protein n=1 Tax=Paludibacterium sp. THUN1379 TaxID=3112107 RepID=UPI0030912D81|nr:glycosyltransferase family 4 protein [Paludibacterium sp. THUN1379]